MTTDTLGGLRLLTDPTFDPAGSEYPTPAYVPLHFEGRAHYSESGAELDRAFAEAGMSDRLRRPVPGEPLVLPLG